MGFLSLNGRKSTGNFLDTRFLFCLGCQFFGKMQWQTTMSVFVFQVLFLYFSIFFSSNWNLHKLFVSSMNIRRGVIKMLLRLLIDTLTHTNSYVKMAIPQEKYLYLHIFMAFRCVTLWRIIWLALLESHTGLPGLPAETLSFHLTMAVALRPSLAVVLNAQNRAQPAYIPRLRTSKS